MARSTGVRGPAEETQARARRPRIEEPGATRGAPTAHTPLRLDRLIHERLRLGIVSALAVNDALTFHDLKTLLQTTDGNLSVHAKRLEEAGYISCRKSVEGGISRTEFRITTAGRRALDKYVAHMEAILGAVRS